MTSISDPSIIRDVQQLVFIKKWISAGKHRLRIARKERPANFPVEGEANREGGQMTERGADPEIRLIPDYRDDEAPLPWYQDLGVCKRMDEQEKPDDRELLHRMYDCLCVRGE